MKTNHLKAFAGTSPGYNNIWGLYHYNIAKNHNQRYTIIGKCDSGFYIIVLTKILLTMYFRPASFYC